jgi:hypothetical protein
MRRSRPTSSSSGQLDGDERVQRAGVADDQVAVDLREARQRDGERVLRGDREAAAHPAEVRQVDAREAAGVDVEVADHAREALQRQEVGVAEAAHVHVAVDAVVQLAERLHAGGVDEQDVAEERRRAGGQLGLHRLGLVGLLRLGRVLGRLGVLGGRQIVDGVVGIGGGLVGHAPVAFAVGAEAAAEVGAAGGDEREEEQESSQGIVLDAER